jgi:hypothetical protein
MEIRLSKTLVGPNIALHGGAGELEAYKDLRKAALETVWQVSIIKSMWATLEPKLTFRYPDLATPLWNAFTILMLIERAIHTLVLQTQEEVSSAQHQELLDEVRLCHQR